MDIEEPASPPPAAAAPAWFQQDAEASRVEALGFRRALGGVHLSKTMMLAGLETLIDEASAPDGAAAAEAVLDRNVLGKRTGSARKLALLHLNALYGFASPTPVQAAALALVARTPPHGDARRLVALLCVLAREPLLRLTAAAVLRATPGTAVRWPELALCVVGSGAGHYSPKMLRSLAQNCASSWTQSGHLRGKVAKRRAVVSATPEAAAYAALLGTLAGFGGPALLRSPWMRVLDGTEEQSLYLLRRAEAAGLARVRAGGGVVQVEVRQPLAQALEVPALVHG